MSYIFINETLALIGHFSLNKEKRRRELIRVTQENQEILKRILAREPEYNHLEWDKEWEENENFMDNVSRYPRDWWELEKQEQEMRKQELKEVSHSKVVLFSICRIFKLKGLKISQFDSSICVIKIKI